MGGKLSRFTPEELSIYESCTCLDGAELTTVYDKFIKMGGRRVTKGVEEASYRRAIGHKTVKNLMAGSAAVALSQVETSTGGAADSTRTSQAHKATQGVRVSKAQVCDLPEFDNNPFAPRLCEVFSSDGSGDLYFDELLDLFHALSPKAEREVKVLTAFRVYDFDGDGYLNDQDITTLIRTTTMKPRSLPSPPSSPRNSSPTSPSSRTSPRTSNAITDGHVAGGGGADLEHGGGAKKREMAKDVLADVVDHVMRECDLDGRGRLSFHEFKRVMDRFPDVEAKFSVQLQ